jgi:hypothetical protein
MVLCMRMQVVRECMRNISELLHQYFNTSLPVTDLGAHANATYNATTDTALIHVPAVLDTIGNNDVQPNYYINFTRQV